MTELNSEPGLNPDEIFDEGLQSGHEIATEELQEEIIDRLIDEGGFDPEEAEAFFDPAPRRGRGRRRGKIHCSARQRATMPQICKGNGSRSYDPAPRRRHRRRSPRRYDPAPQRKVTARKGKKGILAKVRKFALPGAAVGTFLTAYMARATQLKSANAQLDGKVVDGVYAAIMYDVKNFSTDAAMARLKDNAGEIVTPLIAGYAVKQIGILGKYSGLAGDLLTGMGMGLAAKKVLDPPITNSVIQVKLPAIEVKVPCGTCAEKSNFRNPYNNGGY
jgi:hypothetical protein